MGSEVGGEGWEVGGVGWEVEEEGGRWEVQEVGGERWEGWSGVGGWRGRVGSRRGGVGS